MSYSQEPIALVQWLLNNCPMFSFELLIHTRDRWPNSEQEAKSVNVRGVVFSPSPFLFSESGPPRWQGWPPRDSHRPDLCDSGIMALLLAHTARIFILYICSPWHNVPLYIACMLLEWRLLRRVTENGKGMGGRETVSGLRWMDLV